MLYIRERLYIATFQNNAVAAASEYKVNIEFNHTCISENLDPENRPALIEEMRRDYISSGAVSAYLHGPFTEICPAAIDAKARDMALARLEQAYKVCRTMGIHNMVVHNGWLPYIYFKEWQAEKGCIFWTDFMKDKPDDFHIYIENVLEDEPFMMLEMMKKITDPRIGICLDTGHANVMTADNLPVEKWIEVLSPYIGHFHLHNNFADADSHGDFDSGTMKMDSLFTTIEKHCRKDVTFTIEARDCHSCLEWLSLRGYI